MSDRYDVLVLGGDPEALSAAILLAKAGKRTRLICEQEALGGLAAPKTFGDGFTTTGVLHDSHRVRPQAIKRLGLQQHGLSFRPRPAVYGPETEGPGLELPGDRKAWGPIIEARSAEVGEGFKGYRGYLDRVGPALATMMDNPAPSLQADGSLWPLLKSGLMVRRLGKRDMMELLRVAPSCVEDWLSEHFSDPVLRSLIAGPALTGSWMGPLSPTSTLCLLVEDALSGDEVVGGPAGLCKALVSAAKAAGVEVSTGLTVSRLTTEGSRVTGAVLGDGTELTASSILSALGPKRTCLDLLEPGVLAPSIEAEASNIRTRGMVGKVHLGIRGPLRFAGRTDSDVERAWVGPHPHDYERAFDSVRLREMPRRPVLDIRIPSISDSSLAPAQHHMVSVLVHGAGHALSGGWSEARSAELLEGVLDTLEVYAPGIRAQVVADDVITPADLASAFHLPDGHLFFGEVAVDQLWALRPSMRLSRHQVGIDGLWLGSSGGHGGGALSCVAGSLSADALLSR